MSTQQHQTVESKTKFIFELSQDVKRLQQELNEERKRSIEFEQRTSSELSSIRSEQQQQQTKQETLQNDLQKLVDRVVSLENWRERVVGSNLEQVKAEFVSFSRVLEQHISTETKEREAGLWSIFARKQEEIQESNKKAREDIASNWTRAFEEHKSQSNSMIESRLLEVTSTTKALKEGAKALGRLESALKQCETLTQRVEKSLSEIEKASKTKKIPAVSSSPLPTTTTASAIPLQQQSEVLAKMGRVVEEERKRVQEISQKVEQERERINSEFRTFKTEQTKLMREEVEKRVQQEMDWRSPPHSAGHSTPVFEVLSSPQSQTRNQSQSHSNQQQQSPKTTATTTTTTTNQTTGGNSVFIPSAPLISPVKSPVFEPTPTVSQTTSPSNQSENDPVNRSDDFVGKWLESMGLGAYRQKFLAAGFDTELSLKTLDETDLNSLSIATPGHRRVLLHNAKKLK